MRKTEEMNFVDSEEMNLGSSGRWICMALSD